MDFAQLLQAQATTAPSLPTAVTFVNNHPDKTREEMREDTYLALNALRNNWSFAQVSQLFIANAQGLGGRPNVDFSTDPTANIRSLIEVARDNGALEELGNVIRTIPEERRTPRDRFILSAAEAARSRPTSQEGPETDGPTAAPATYIVAAANTRNVQSPAYA